MNLISSASEIVHDVCRTPSARGEIHVRFPGNFPGDEFVQRVAGAMRQENRAGLRIQRLDVADAVVLLVHARQLVLFDDAAQIFLAARRGHDAGLRMLAHDLPV